MVSHELLEGCIFEWTRLHRPNVVRCKIIYGDQRIILAGAYISPSTLAHLLAIEEGLSRFLGRDTVVLGDLNSDIRRLKNTRDQQVAEFLVSFELVDIIGHFYQYLHYRHL